MRNSNFNKSPLDEETLLSGQFWGELRVFLGRGQDQIVQPGRGDHQHKPADGEPASQAPPGRGRLAAFHLDRRAGVKLTQKGEALAQALSRLDYTLYSITSDLKAESREAEGTVRVSITDGLNVLFAVPALSQFSAQYPKIQLHLKSPLNLMNLRENQTDIMIGFVPSISSDIQIQKARPTPFHSNRRERLYCGNTGCRRRSNLEQHLFIQSEYYWHERGCGIAGSKRRRAGGLRTTATIRSLTACW